MKQNYIVAIIFLLLISISIQGGMIKTKKPNELPSSLNLNFENCTDGIFDKILMQVMKTAHMSSLSTAIIKGNKVIWAKGYGIYDREKNKEADEKTIYLVASISKTITATAIMQLYEKGYFKLDEDVSKYLPFKLRNPNHPDKPITFKMLLSHTSSLSEDPPAFYSCFPGDLEVKGYPYPWLEEYLLPGKIHYKPQIWSKAMPGEEMHYANVGFSLLGYLVELLSGEPFEEYCEKNIFKPLKMGNTSFFLKNLNASNIAVPYIYDGKYEPLLHYAILDYPAGGLRTNVIDLSHFLIAHMNNGIYNGIRILNESSIEEMHSIHASNNRYTFNYGFGSQIWKIGGETYIGHTGGLYGVATKMVYRKSDKIGVIFFTNKEVRNLREIIAFALIERLLFWKATHDMNELNKNIIQETIKADKCLIKELDNATLFP